MIHRLPLIPTMVVVAAVATMIGLGVWQLDRARYKDSLRARYVANVQAPAMAFPNIPIGDELLFRRASAFCLKPFGLRLRGAGAGGYRAIVQCRTSAEGPGFAVQLGLARDPRARPTWQGGAVTGYLATEPDSRPFWTRWFDRQPTKLMLVASTPAAGLAPNPPADPAAVVNNSRSYAGQWFLFAASALIIYALAVRAKLGRVQP